VTVEPLLVVFPVVENLADGSNHLSSLAACGAADQTISNCFADCSLYLLGLVPVSVEPQLDGALFVENLADESDHLSRFAAYSVDVDHTLSNSVATCSPCAVSTSQDGLINELNNIAYSVSCGITFESIGVLGHARHLDYSRTHRNQPSLLSLSSATLSLSPLLHLQTWLRVASLFPKPLLSPSGIALRVLLQRQVSMNCQRIVLPAKS